VNLQVTAAREVISALVSRHNKELYYILKQCESLYAQREMDDVNMQVFVSDIV